MTGNPNKVAMEVLNRASRNVYEREKREHENTMIQTMRELTVELRDMQVALRMAKEKRSWCKRFASWCGMPCLQCHRRHCT